LGKQGIRKEARRKCRKHTEELDVVELHGVGEEETTNCWVNIKNDEEDCDDRHEKRGSDREAQRQPAGYNKQVSEISSAEERPSWRMIGTTSQIAYEGSALRAVKDDVVHACKALLPLISPNITTMITKHYMHFIRFLKGEMNRNGEGVSSTRQSVYRGQWRKCECGEERMQLSSNRASASSSGGSRSAKSTNEWKRATRSKKARRCTEPIMKNMEAPTRAMRK